MDDIGGIWRTVGGRRIFIKKGQDLATAMKESGKFSRNGLGASNKYTEENHPKPKRLGKIEDLSEENIIKTLKNYEKKIKNDKIENAIVITSNGEIYQCFGSKDHVWPDVDLGEKLKGAYVTHNHPKKETEFSFSKDDRLLFNNYKLKVLRGVDYKYTYELNSILPPILNIPCDYLYSDYGMSHLSSIQYALDNNICYSRWENE